MRRLTKGMEDMLMRVKEGKTALTTPESSNTLDGLFRRGLLATTQNGGLRFTAAGKAMVDAIALKMESI